MPRPAGLSQWQQTVSTHLPHLSKPQVLVLSLWSAGIVLAQSCGLTQVAVILAYLLDRSEQAVREQLRRAERLWLAMALATLWVISVGCAAEAALPVPVFDHLPDTHVARRTARGPRPPRSMSCFQRVQATLSENNITRIRWMSAELNGLYALYDGQIGLARQDMQLIVSSDTALGRLCADLIAEYLRGHGLPVQTMIPTGLTTATSAAFEAGIKSLIVECDKLLPSYHDEGYSVVFNLVGGFKALQGYLNTIGMFYADEMLYLFEGSTAAPMYIPRLPIKIDLDALTPYAVPLAMMAEAPTTVPLSHLGALQRTLYDTNDQENAEISQWGQLVWNQARGDLLSGSLLPFPLLRYETGFINDYKRTLNPTHRARLQSQLASVAAVLGDHHGNAAALKGRGGIEYDNYTSKQMNGKHIGHFRVSDGVRVSCIADGGGLTLRHFGEHDYVNKNP